MGRKRANPKPGPSTILLRVQSEPAAKAHVKHFPPPRTEIPCRSPQRAVWDPGTSGNGFGEGSRPRWGSAEPRQTRNYSYKARILLSSSSGCAGAGSRGPGRAEHSSSPYKAPPGCRGHQRGPPGHYSQEGLALAPSSPAERHGGCGAKGQGPSVPTPSRAHAKAVAKESPGAPPCQVSSSAFVSVDKSEINPEQRPPWRAGRAAGPRAACSRPESPQPQRQRDTGRGAAPRHLGGWGRNPASSAESRTEEQEGCSPSPLRLFDGKQGVFCARVILPEDLSSSLPVNNARPPSCGRRRTGADSQHHRSAPSRRTCAHKKLLTWHHKARICLPWAPGKCWCLPGGGSSEPLGVDPRADLHAHAAAERGTGPMPRACSKPAFLPGISPPLVCHFPPPVNNTTSRPEHRSRAASSTRRSRGKGQSTSCGTVAVTELSATTRAAERSPGSAEEREQGGEREGGGVCFHSRTQKGWA